MLLLKKYTTFHESQGFITIFSTAFHGPYLSEKNPVHSFQPDPKIHFDTILPFIPRSLPFRLYSHSFVEITYLPHVCYNPSPPTQQIICL
jgi:hypothetical protein